ncbi:hypothetical protein BCEP4_790058 [Burkholderia cepacia]|nr:hypothetical protein BCEP4_790058 [Burkholderia cepacia]
MNVRKNARLATGRRPELIPHGVERGPGDGAAGTPRVSRQSGRGIPCSPTSAPRELHHSCATARCRFDLCCSGVDRAC